jgi:hypothetical protein
VCLAAEKCKHVAFDSKPDMWWSHAGFHCDEAPASHVTFVDILLKVRAARREASWQQSGSSPRCVPRSQDALQLLIVLWGGAQRNVWMLMTAT